VQNATHSIGSNIKRYVTFYFTNVPDMVPYFIVKEGFEVCGILDNIFLSRKRNKQGHIYSFVRYANVRDVEKMLKALNNISFGQFRVWAKIARFGRKPLEFVKTRVSEGVRGECVVRKKEDKREDSKLLFEGEKKDCEGGKMGVGYKTKKVGEAMHRSGRM
jgi:RNA recognition motif-containing protein